MFVLFLLREKKIERAIIFFFLHIKILKIIFFKTEKSVEHQFINSKLVDLKNFIPLL